jgi:uncharacterized protein
MAAAFWPSTLAGFLKMHIVDRRLNPQGKSLANRQRFLRRAKAQIRRAVRETSSGRGIRDLEQGGEIAIPTDGIREPSFRRAMEGGKRDHILPGNKEYQAGDTLPRPSRSSGAGVTQGSDESDGEDAFRFSLTHEEFMELFLDDLELPDLAKQKLAQSDQKAWRRAGFSVTGSPANLALTTTLRNSLSRRLALKRPKPEDVAALREEITRLEEAGAGESLLADLRLLLERQEKRARTIPYIDPLDIRYRRSESYPRPAAQAVMFCIMDVSGSMSEAMKDLAKRFFMLLYVFLRRRYRNVDVVFIRHTHVASEVDEETFFRSSETGGTVVSSALEIARDIIKARYPAQDWNLYVAQASDGDNTPSDNERSTRLMDEALLPVCQYYAYLEVGRDDDSIPMGFATRQTEVWRTYQKLLKEKGPLAMRKVRHRRDIYPVFRDLFQKKEA